MEKYQGAAEQLREKLEGLENQIAELQYTNEALRNELAETLNENYVNRTKISALLKKQELIYASGI